MLGPLVQILVLVGMTHGVRALARRVGPGRGGLLMGVPSTTALVLVGCGLERGLDEATLAAETCLAGLVAAATLPLAYARAATLGWRAAAAAGAAAAAYLAVAASLWWLPGVGAVGCVVGAGVGVVLACRQAGRAPAGGSGTPAGGSRGASGARALVYRTAVPAGYFLTLRALRAVLGPDTAGRFITFPGASLAVLVTTHLEAGPEAARKLASAMPSGNLGMLAFLTTFRFACPGVGLGWGTALGFVAAVAVLAALGSRPGRRDQAPLAAKSRKKASTGNGRSSGRRSRERGASRKRARAQGRRRATRRRRRTSSKNAVVRG